MMKIQLVCLALCSLTQAVYISRMSTVNRMRGPTAFRPGVNLQRPWGPTRLVAAASHRAPYVIVRNPSQRYAMKHYGPSSTRNVFNGHWKTTPRLPMSTGTSEYEFIKAASSAPAVHTDGGTGAIHTIPAPNLSLSEKPIVVIETSSSPSSERPKPSYEVTEKYSENDFNVAKIETPIGFSKATSFSTPDLQTLIRNGAALQFASEYSLPAIAMSQHQIPQQFSFQGFNNIQSHRDIPNTGETVYVPPNAIFQSDPMFLQKLQNQLMQRFQAVEFIPYAADVQNQVHLQPQASQNQPQIILLENEQLNKPLEPASQTEEKNIVQREAQETTVVTFVPQPFTLTNNTTEKPVEMTTTPQAHNITFELVAAESQPMTTTIKYVVESNVEAQNTTPIYYAQIGQSVGNLIANGFYSAINDVRAAAALAQVDKVPENKTVENATTTTPTTPLSPDLKTYFVAKEEKAENLTATELKPLLGAPFSKSDSVNVAYTLVRANENQPKVNQEGAVYAGQIVEATISEDQDFNKEKASFITKRAPIRLFAVTDSKSMAISANTPKVTVVKAKIPPKSKLTFDDKTGEPILRIYASYVDPGQKDAVVSKLAALKHAKEAVTRKDTLENFKAATVRSMDKSHGFDKNQVTHFGLKLRDRSDDYVPLFEEYDE